MKDITIWLTYHDDRQIQEYTLEETKEIRLFKGNDISVQGDHINHLNKFYSEMTTMYYVWKNRIVSTKVGFCHYRRRFVDYFDVEEGQCQVLAINYGLPVFQHYKSAHNFQDLYDVVDILNDQYGVNNKYSRHLYDEYCRLIRAVYPSIRLGGRLGCYQYYDMDDVVAKALQEATLNYQTN